MVRGNQRFSPTFRGLSGHVAATVRAARSANAMINKKATENMMIKADNASHPYAETRYPTAGGPDSAPMLPSWAIRPFAGPIFAGSFTSRGTEAKTWATRTPAPECGERNA